MAIYNQRIKITKQQLADSYQSRESIGDYIYGTLRFLGIILQNLYCVSSYLVLSWIVFLPLSWIRLDLYAKVENCLYNSLLFIVSSWSMAAGAQIVEAGDEYKHLVEGPEHLPQADPLKLSQHQHLNNYTINNNNDNNNNVHSNNNNNNIISHKNNQNNNHHIKIRPTSDHKKLNTIPIRVNGDIIPRAFINGSNGALDKTIQRSPRVLLLCNHISTADVPLIMQSFSTLTNQSVLWVLDALFRPTNFGVVCSSHGDFFVEKNSFVDGTLRDQVLRHPDRNLLVLFPEGGFLRKRIEGSNRYAARNNLPTTKYVTHPRFGAFKDLMDPSVGVTHIVDATLMYDNIENPLSILNIALGNRKEPAILHYKVYERERINPSDEWLRNIWLEKDKMLEKFYEDRDKVLSSFESTLRTAALDWYKLLSVHLFYLLVCYLTMYRLFSATNIMMLTAKDLYYSNI